MASSFRVSDRISNNRFLRWGSMVVLVSVFSAGCAWIPPYQYPQGYSRSYDRAISESAWMMDQPLATELESKHGADWTFFPGVDSNYPTGTDVKRLPEIPEQPFRSPRRY